MNKGNVLRPYQAQAVMACHDRWEKEPGSKILIVAPTGAGKTVAIEELIGVGHRFSVVVVHTTTLLEQTSKRIPWTRVVTIQSLIAEGKTGDKLRAEMQRAEIVAYDEAHHVCSEEWLPALDVFPPTTRHFGVTATPVRADKKPLGMVFDHLVPMGKYSTLTRDSYLCPCDIWSPTLTRKEQQARKVKPDAVLAYLQNGKRAGGGWRPGIYFDTTKANCQEAHERFTEAGLRSGVITSGTKKTERLRLMKLYAEGKLDMLCSPMVLAEGFDSPRAEVCILARRCGHVGLFLQCVGRVLRPFPGKERALLIDVTDACSLHGRPTDDRVYSLTGEPMKTVEATEREAKEFAEKVEWEVEEAEFKFIADTAIARYKEFKAVQERRGYKPAWVMLQMQRVTGIKQPQSFFSKSQSVCLHCRKRVAVGDRIFWTGPKEVYHPECWFNKLAREEPTVKAWARGY